jgi:hypothetical protein
VTYFKDLAPCRYFRNRGDKRLLAIGWLEPERRFESDRVERSWSYRLVELLNDPWQPQGFFRGSHGCGFCRADDAPVNFDFEDRRAELGFANLFVPGSLCVYVAPSLIAHYIVEHDYSPPVAFQEAVVACPEMCSVAYFHAIASVAPPWLKDLAIERL